MNVTVRTDLPSEVVAHVSDELRDGLPTFVWLNAAHRDHWWEALVAVPLPLRAVEQLRLSATAWRQQPPAQREEQPR